jgi:RNA polymerase sigma factor (sigma-70 family)
MNKTIGNFSDYEQRQLEVAERILGHGGTLAQDACQQARIAVYRHISSDKEPIRDFWPYFRAVTVHACYEILRVQYRTQSLFARALERYVIAEAPDPVRAVMQADLLLTSDRIIRKELGVPYVDIFRLCYLDGLSLRAISVRLNMPVSTVKNHNKKILETLRRTLDLR